MRPSNCPHCVALQVPVRTQVNPVRSPSRALAGCGIRPSDEGPDPADTPTNGGSRGAAPQVSMFRDWLAANDPQTPSVPGTRTAPGLQTPLTMGQPRAYLSRRSPGPVGSTTHTASSRGHGRTQKLGYSYHR
ncbi:uncharacterized protein ATNIH1004_010469 [Aspergillus tanneri]|uniref:Uncharacterized protein n=1 Tax=Aspergillus tanneri TaxID=1220188 RepID=A0A5M9M9H2_9EURO|nr:uncharacterized protein ATNIH1004_010469 [Aspergillus tanneri]KAA8643695.1 hypothetical protein ATNIH1004_010469 [Aspergillus tanneri]